jgi:hypothetical protein
MGCIDWMDLVLHIVIEVTKDPTAFGDAALGGGYAIDLFD